MLNEYFLSIWHENFPIDGERHAAFRNTSNINAAMTYGIASGHFDLYHLIKRNVIKITNSPIIN